ncbi:hypothetical protein UFOVP225_74 [uncultured Caudovirales phage]|uniref:Uncharacterized protein n=1 Tax=uncultured Caudovirales phage TaxID=2100421 RepID=A0A6J5L1U2_9CAUD|nr:hypothetical protein UFOVP113_87 [uncultured Caudovirales phage]CAB5219466.1 hypothetical protein UFOVP225_74 [uncultured Caudovirales phage]
MSPQEIVYVCEDCNTEGKIHATTDGQIAVTPCECVGATNA